MIWYSWYVDSTISDVITNINNTSSAVTSCQTPPTSLIYMVIIYSADEYKLYRYNVELCQIWTCTEREKRIISLENLINMGKHQAPPAYSYCINQQHSSNRLNMWWYTDDINYTHECMLETSDMCVGGLSLHMCVSLFVYVSVFLPVCVCVCVCQFCVCVCVCVLM